MKKMNYFLVCLMSLALLGACGSFKAKRVGSAEGDDLALNITDKWVAKDTENTVKDIITQLEKHPGIKEYLQGGKKKRPKVFISEIKNDTSDAYFPISEINEEFLNELSASGQFQLVDAAAREHLLKEITYQNDGMVNPAQAKMIGKQSGADALIFGNVQMKPETRDGKTIKQYSLNIRFTELETSNEIARLRAKTQKYSEQKSTGW